MKLFNKDELYYFNTIQIQLQVIFFSDLVNWNTNYINRHFGQGFRDLLRVRKFKWLEVIPVNKPRKLWIKFINQISNNNILLSPITFKDNLIY